MTEMNWPLIVTAALTIGGAMFFFWALRRAQARRKAQYQTERVAQSPSELPEAMPTREIAPPVPEPTREGVPPTSEPAAEQQVEVSAEHKPADAAPSEVPVASEVPSQTAGPDEHLVRGLKKTQQSLLGRMSQIFGGGRGVDDSVLDELEEALLSSDVGVKLTMRLVDELRERVASKKVTSEEDVRSALRSQLSEVLGTAPDAWNAGDDKPKVILFVGVNGVGKTTSIGKVASKLRAEGHSVLLAAGDTFRAAAAEQLEIWSERAGCDFVKGQEKADPASVIFDAIKSARAKGSDYVLADTAGRLHTKTELMDELKKVHRAVGKAREGAPDQTWLVVDATTGQNALLQAKEFNEMVGLTGIILTKLDGTAKGGVVLAIADALQIPIRFIGVGETADDLRPFHPGQFVDALFA